MTPPGKIISFFAAQISFAAGKHHHRHQAVTSSGNKSSLGFCLFIFFTTHLWGEREAVYIYIYYSYRSFIYYILYSITLFRVEGVGGREDSYYYYFGRGRDRRAAV